MDRLIASGRTPAPIRTHLELAAHPLDDTSTQRFDAAFAPTTTLAHLIPAGARVTATVDGAEVPPEAWAMTTVSGRSVRIAAVAEGDLLRTALQVAVVAASLAVGSPWLAAAILVVGSLAINALFPPPTPDFGGSGADPLFSLNGSSSRARLYETLPLVLGRHRVVADLAARIRTYFDGDDQWLEGVWHFGLGAALHVDETTLAFGELAFSGLEDVTYKVAAKPTLVAGNVDTVAGATLTTTAVARQASTGSVRVEIDLTGRLFRIDKKGKTVAHTVPVEVTIGTMTHTLNVTHDSQSPLRRTYGWDLDPPAAPAVSVRRTSEASSSDRVYDDVSLAAVRSIQPDTGTYTGQTRIGVRVRASGQLQGSLPPLVAMCSQRVPTWDEDENAWTDDVRDSSNPAAILRWYARGVTVSDQLVAGIGMGAAEIDDAELGRWYVFCDDKGLGCNAVLTGGATHDDTLRMITQCGRARVVWTGGLLSVSWEDPDALTQAIISPANIVAGSVQLRYTTTPPDEVVLRFVDPALDWAMNSVRRRRPGATSVARSITVTGRGITSAAQAAREATRLLASQTALARQIGWRMGRDGVLLEPGQIVSVSHSLIDGGETGRVAQIVSPTRLVLDADGAAVGDTLLVMRPDGTMTQAEITAVDDRAVTLGAALTVASDTDVAADTLWRRYSATAPQALAWILAVTPAQDDEWNITATEITPAYRAALASADVAVYTRPPPPVQTPVVVDVTFATLRLGGRRQLSLSAMVTTSGVWSGAVVLAGESADYADAIPVARLGPGEQIATWNWADRGEATAYVEIRPLGGSRWRGSYTPTADVIAPPTALALNVASDRTRELTWTDPEDDNLRGIVLRYGAVADPVVWANLLPMGGPYAGGRVETALPPSGTWTVAARAVSDSGAQSSVASVTVVVGEQPATYDDADVRTLIQGLRNDLSALQAAFTGHTHPHDHD
ncbi:MAG: host specificity factor TipJ family phage tail protein [Chromatiales bacterium]|nr:host specificity factor TipJ family phage tail protein [Chromatiales bacterium]